MPLLLVQIYYRVDEQAGQVTLLSIVVQGVTIGPAQTLRLDIRLQDFRTLIDLGLHAH